MGETLRNRRLRKQGGGGTAGSATAGGLADRAATEACGGGGGRLASRDRRCGRGFGTAEAPPGERPARILRGPFSRASSLFLLPRARRSSATSDSSVPSHAELVFVLL